jgi:hypothetical protein
MLYLLDRKTSFRVKTPFSVISLPRHKAWVEMPLWRLGAILLASQLMQPEEPSEPWKKAATGFLSNYTDSTIWDPNAVPSLDEQRLALEDDALYLMYTLLRVLSSSYKRPQGFNQERLDELEEKMREEGKYDKCFVPLQKYASNQVPQPPWVHDPEAVQGAFPLVDLREEFAPSGTRGRSLPPLPPHILSLVRKFVGLDSMCVVRVVPSELHLLTACKHRLAGLLQQINRVLCPTAPPLNGQQLLDEIDKRIGVLQQGFEFKELEDAHNFHRHDYNGMLNKTDNQLNEQLEKERKAKEGCAGYLESVCAGAALLRQLPLPPKQLRDRTEAQEKEVLKSKPAEATRFSNQAPSIKQPAVSFRGSASSQLHGTPLSSLEHER